MSKLKNFQNSSKQLARVIGLTSKDSDARIIYPLAGIQKKERVPKAKSLKDRKLYAQNRLYEINLLIGANVEISNSTFINLIKVHFEASKNSYEHQQLRYDTYRSYKSLANCCIEIIQQKGLNKQASDIRKKDIIEILEFVLYEKKLTPRSRNNYLSYLSTVFLFGIDRDLVTINPCAKIPKIKNTTKIRKVIPKLLLKEVLEKIKKENQPYFVMCLTVYYCFIRRTEITKLKVKHIQLHDHVFSLPGTITKNKKYGIVTIPDTLMDYLINHIKDAKLDDYLFSKNFKPGKEKLRANKITDYWSKLRNKFEIPNEYQFYSLKDTGITRLFELGIPTIKIRDQARHHDIKVTETYTPRNYEFDNLIKSQKDNF